MTITNQSWLSRPPEYWRRFTAPLPATPTMTPVLRLKPLALGWRSLELKTGADFTNIVMSPDCDYIPALLTWLQALIEGDLPAAVDFDDNGEMRLAAHAHDEGRVLIAIFDFNADEVDCLAAVVARDELVEAFGAEIARFVEHDLDNESSRYKNETEEERRAFLESLRAHPLLARYYDGN